jgi:hypothetical protein
MQGLFDKLFLAHPRSKGETYWQHFMAALRLWIKIIGALLALGVHIVIPGFFQTTASQLISKCHKDMTGRGNVQKELIDEIQGLESSDDPRRSSTDETMLGGSKPTGDALDNE